MSQETVNAALAYRHAGLQVVPSFDPAEHAQWKRPVGLWRQWTHDPVPDVVWETWLAGRFAQHANLGLITGQVSGGVFVIDLDTHSKPQAGGWWLGLIAVHNHGIEIETPCQRTGGGGLQILFRAPPGWRAPTGKTALGVDIRGEGGFAVLPPSHHSSGQDYVWLPGRAPDEVDIATAPDWLCQAIDTLLAIQPEIPTQTAQNSAQKENGAGLGKEFTTTRAPKSNNPPNATVTPIGQFKTDLREAYMIRLIWAALVGLKRQCMADGWPGSPLEADREAAWQDYLAHVESRLPGSYGDLPARLEQEGRGRTLFLEKWRYAVAKWDGAIAAAAAKPDPNPDPEEILPRDSRQESQELQATRFTASESLGTPQEQGEEAFDRTATPAIMATEFAPIRWVIPGYVPEGFAVLAGRQKLGKTWLLIDWAIATASGGSAMSEIQCQQGDVLYIDLENGKRRIKRRIETLYPLTAYRPDLARLEWVNDAPPFGEAFIRRLDQWRLSVANPRLVLIDVLQRIKPPGIRTRNAYENDYAIWAPLQAWATQHGIAVVGGHHTKKGEADDPLEMFSGSNGLGAVADTPLLLNRTSKGTTLYVRGRDVEELETALKFEGGHWTILGSAADVQRSDERTAILDSLKETDAAMTIGDLASATEMKFNNVKRLLVRMAKDGEIIRTGKGVYSLPPSPRGPLVP